MGLKQNLFYCFYLLFKYFEGIDDAMQAIIIILTFLIVFLHFYNTLVKNYENATAEYSACRIKSGMTNPALLMNPSMRDSAISSGKTTRHLAMLNGR